MKQEKIKHGITLSIISIIFFSVFFYYTFSKIIPNLPQITSTKQNEEIMLVKKVVDGDTIELQNEKKVRYIGIDTPEVVDPRKPVQCFGEKASRKNKELVESRYVRLEKDVSEVDKYGRLLRYVYVNDLFVNLELVKNGFAFAATFPPDVKYAEKFLDAEREARNNKIGLWKECPENK